MGEQGEGRTEGQELGRRVDMEQHEGGSASAGATGEPVQRPEQRGPGLGHLPPHGHVHLLAGERRLRRIIGVRRGRRGGAGRGCSHARALQLLRLVRLACSLGAVHGGRRPVALLVGDLTCLPFLGPLYPFI